MEGISLLTEQGSVVHISNDYREFFVQQLSQIENAQSALSQFLEALKQDESLLSFRSQMASLEAEANKLLEEDPRLDLLERAMVLRRANHFLQCNECIGGEDCEQARYEMETFLGMLLSVLERELTPSAEGIIEKHFTDERKHMAWMTWRYALLSSVMRMGAEIRAVSLVTEALAARRQGVREVTFEDIPVSAVS